jgi:hypothetical protein
MKHASLYSHISSRIWWMQNLKSVVDQMLTDDPK